MKSNFGPEARPCQSAGGGGGGGGGGETAHQYSLHEPKAVNFTYTNNHVHTSPPHPGHIPTLCTPLSSLTSSPPSSPPHPTGHILPSTLIHTTVDTHMATVQNNGDIFQATPLPQKSQLPLCRAQLHVCKGYCSCHV